MKSMDVLAKLRRRVAQAPTGPGVYRWLDAEGNILYVGKAKNLRNRLKSYVQTGAKRSAWTEILVRSIADLDVTVTGTELEALMLETNLIKRHRPKFNIMMKDDKNYVYVRISLQETYPRIDVVRRMDKDGALYFGPKTSAEEVRSALGFLRTIFPYRTCKMGIEKKDSKESEESKESKVVLEVICTDRDRPTPCIDHHIKQCSGPCIGEISPEQYREKCIDGVVSFFQGKYHEVERILQAEMAHAAQSKRFERAAKLRDHLRHVQALQEKQLISDTSHANTDVIGITVLSGRAVVVVLSERDGKLIGEQHFSLQGNAESIAEVIGQFIPQYFSDAADIPDTVIVGEEPEEHTALEAWLTETRGKKVTLHVPERGKKSKLLLLAERNAEEKAKAQEASFEADARKTDDALRQLKEHLQLSEFPKRIEGYDISHMGGSETVASMVVFENGKPKRAHYRSFTVRTVKRGDVDDYQSLKEALSRRLKYLAIDPKREAAIWHEQGITIGKAKKADQVAIETISKAHPNDIGSDSISYKDYVVALCNGEVVGCCRLFTYPGKVLCLRSVWVHEQWRGKRLGHTLIRTALKRIRKGKVYMHVTKESLIEYYAELGFQPVRTPPPVLQAKLDNWTKDHLGHEAGNILVYIASEQKPDDSFTTTPDIILIDGGKGQVSTVAAVLKDMGLTIPLIGLAKREELVYRAGQTDPLPITPTSSGGFLLQRVRDEAHRFANDRRERKAKVSLTSSALNEVPGVGEETRTKLLKKFGSVDAIKQASDEELLELVNETQLEQIRKKL